RAHTDIPRSQLDIPSRAVIENRDDEQVFSSPRGRDVPTALTQYEADLRLVVHLRGLDGLGRTSLERLESHRWNRVARPDDVQVVPVVVRGEEIPFRWDGGPCRGAGSGDVRPEREEVPEQARDDRRMQPHVGQPERP